VATPKSLFAICDLLFAILPVPELAEVEQNRRVWHRGQGQKILAVTVQNVRSPVWRGVRSADLVLAITGKPLTASETHGKKMLFQFGRDTWLGIHLGMTGVLTVETAGYRLQKHDHLVLRLARHSLVFSDQRRFGRLRLARGADQPIWWTRLPPPILSDRFTVDWVAEFCARRKRTPLKPLLLMQDRFPGIGNWMADEILWRARLHPKALAGGLAPATVKKLYQAIRRVTVSAMNEVDENWEFPSSWLFSHRWKDGGHCPRCGTGLLREKIGGRTTCWCPSCQLVAPSLAEAEPQSSK
jgi:formamidopyrimidine-DNA glycosylase